MIPQWVMREVYGDPVEDEPTFTDRGVTREHTARKRLSCEDCPADRGIQPGERYRVHVGLDEHGDFFCSRSCSAMPDACRAALPPEPVRVVPCGPAAPYDPDNIPF